MRTNSNIHIAYSSAGKNLFPAGNEAKEVEQGQLKPPANATSPARNKPVFHSINKLKASYAGAPTNEELRRFEAAAIDATKQLIATFDPHEVLTQKKLCQKINTLIKEQHQKLDELFASAVDPVLTSAPGSPAKKITARDRSKDRVRTSILGCFQQWIFQLQRGSMQWEEGSPLLLKPGLSFKSLQHVPGPTLQGGFGSLFHFKNEDGKLLLGKKIYFSKTSQELNELDHELRGYSVVYGTQGVHPNLVNVYGIGSIQVGTGMQRVILMDHVPGPTGEEGLKMLKNSWKSGQISSQEYWGAVQFIGRRLLDVTEHFGQSGTNKCVVHNDIKPGNFLIHEHTGEPIVIDLGGWSFDGEKSRHITKSYSAPESLHRQPVGESSDVFSVGATLLSGIEGYKFGSTNDFDGMVRQANQGLRRTDIRIQKPDGTSLCQPGRYAADTAYTYFMEQLLLGDEVERVNSEEAKNLPFLNDGLLDDAAAKKVIVKVFSAASPLSNAPFVSTTPFVLSLNWNDIRQEIQNFLNSADLSTYRRLRIASKHNQELQFLLDSALCSPQREICHLVMEVQAQSMLTAPAVLQWPFQEMRQLAFTMQPLKAGVDDDGVAIYFDSNDQHIDVYDEEGKRQVDHCEPSRERLEETFNAQFGGRVSFDQVREFADNAEKFLYESSILHSPNAAVSYTPWYTFALETIREHALVARRLVGQEEKIDKTQTSHFYPLKLNDLIRTLSLKLAKKNTKEKVDHKRKYDDTNASPSIFKNRRLSF